MTQPTDLKGSAPTTAEAPPTDPDALTLHCAGVDKAFGDLEVLRGIDLEVAPGEIVAVLGPSGSGKTTLLRIIAGFETADAGTVTISGSLVEGRGTRTATDRRGVGLVPQEGALFPHLDVAHNVGFGLRRRGTSSAERAERVAECIALVGLEGEERTRPDELSGGQQQRVALARALAPQPEVVMLDEPFSSLDPGLRARIREDVCATLRAARCTAVIVTHDQEEALSMADRVGVLLDGKLAQYADPVTVYRRPASVEVATFVGEATVIPGLSQAGHCLTPVGPVPGGVDLADGEVDVVVRPEQVRLDPEGDSTPAWVVSNSFLGHDGRLVLAVRGLEVPIVARVDRPEHHQVGDQVAIGLSGDVATFLRRP